MTTLFRHSSSVICFYCQSSVTPIPRNPRSFRCPHCECWNRYDAKGDIVSDEPAMHDESLNARSFARRASPRKDQLPASYGNAFFCDTCQRNQMLLQNLLANYLPPSDDPDYEKRTELLPEYRRSLEARYPPICATCMPSVEEEIRKRDQMARVRALGGALRTTKGTDSRRRTDAMQREREKLNRELRVWRIRGCLWVASAASAIVGYASIICAYHLITLPNSFPPILWAVVLVSILWTGWDRSYATVRIYQFQGRAVRVHGKRQYSSLQFVNWITRLATATLLFLPRFKPSLDPVHLWTNPFSPCARIYVGIMLLCELATLLVCALLLKVHHPPPVRLINSRGPSTTSSMSSRDGTPIMAEPDMLSTLTLSNRPIISVQHPIFGIPSLHNMGSQSPSGITHGMPRSPDMDVDMDHDDGDDNDNDESGEPDPNAMDIDLISPVKLKPMNNDRSWLGPQRFFAPEEPTGLENLFARTIRLVDTYDWNERAVQPGGWKYAFLWVGSLLRAWRTWLVLSFVPLIAVGYKAWDVYRHRGMIATTNPNI